MSEEQKNEKKEKKSKIKGFFSDFTAFIKRGNVLDMAVGVIVGGAFTAIVNALSNQILKPIINWLLALILGKGSLNEVYTFLSTAYTVDASGNQIIDLANSIYIDWGAFINAIINFLLIAFVLFVIVKVIVHMQKLRERTQEAIEAAVEKRIAEREAERAAEEAKNESAEETAETAEKIDDKDKQ